jgi:hypothetical protein
LADTFISSLFFIFVISSLFLFAIAAAAPTTQNWAGCTKEDDPAKHRLCPMDSGRLRGRWLVVRIHHQPVPVVPFKLNRDLGGSRKIKGKYRNRRNIWNSRYE